MSFCSSSFGFLWIIQTIVMDNWTEVRYGRRRQRALQPQWDRRGGRPVWGMDRALFSPGGGEQPFTHPNQPVPPLWANQYAGPGYRSYAEVAHQGGRRGDHRRFPLWTQGGFQRTREFFPTHDRQTDTRREAADPQLGRLIRKLYAVIKTVHHLQNVAPKPGKAEPVMISRMVDTLSTMIKPAAPIQRTAQLILGNAMNWGHTTLLILKEHYENCLKEFQADLTGIITPDWKDAFEVAVRWARRNLPRITQDTIDHAEALITATQVEVDALAQQQSSEQVDLQTQTHAEKKKSRRDIHQVKQPADHQSTSCLPQKEKAQVPKRRRRGSGIVLTEDSPPHTEPEQQVVMDSDSDQGSSEEVDSSDLQTEEEEEARVSSPRSSGKMRAPVHQEQSSTRKEVFADSLDYFSKPEPGLSGVSRHPKTQRKRTDRFFETHKKILKV